MAETISKTEPADEEAEDNQEEDNQQDDGKALASSRRKKACSVWDYFTKLDPESAMIAECNLCNKSYNYATTTLNLKSHLASSHIDSFPNWEDLQRNMRPTVKARKNRSVLWKYFEKIDKYHAQCIACGQKLSFKSTIHSLKLHLIRRHPLALTFASEKLQERESPYEDVQYLELGNEEEQHSDSPETVQEGSIGRYFVSEGEGRSRCSLCEASTYVPRQHLAKKHPKVLAALAAESTDDEDEKPSRGAAAKDPLHSSTVLLVHNESKHSKNAKRRKDQESSSEDDTPLRKKRNDDQTQDIFMQYISTLLRGVPSELYLQLQMDIVNLIMKAKLNHERQQAFANTLNSNTSHQQPMIVPNGASVRTVKIGNISNLNSAVDSIVAEAIIE